MSIAAPLVAKAAGSVDKAIEKPVHSFGDFLMKGLMSIQDGMGRQPELFIVVFVGALVSVAGYIIQSKKAAKPAALESANMLPMKDENDLSTHQPQQDNSEYSIYNACPKLTNKRIGRALMVTGGVLIVSSMAVAIRVSEQHRTAELELRQTKETLEQSVKDRVTKLFQEITQKIWSLTNAAYQSVLFVYNDTAETVTVYSDKVVIPNTGGSVKLEPSEWACLQIRTFLGGVNVVFRVVSSDGTSTIFSGKKEHLDFMLVKTILAPDQAHFLQTTLQAGNKQRPLL